MSHTYGSFRYFSGIVLGIFLSNIIAPTLQYTFAVSTTYYVDATSGSDGNNGTSLATPWKTLTNVNTGSFLPSDIISFRCGDSWTGSLALNHSGGTLTPITYNSYSSGAVCDGTNKPIVQAITASGVSDIQVNGLAVNATITGSAIDLMNSSNVTVSNSDIMNASGSCMSDFAGTGLLIDENNFSSCTYAFSGTDVGGTFSGNIFSGMTENAISIFSNQVMTISNNTFSSLQKGAVVFGQATTVSQNNISSVCLGTSTGCSAIRNEEYSPLGTLYIADISSNIIKDVGSGISGNNYGISIKNIDGSIIGFNTVNNAEEALHIEDAKNLNIHDNTLIFSRARGVQVIQNIASSVSANSFDTNKILEKNPDYPYIEMRDEVAGGATATMLSAANTIFYPIYKPNTSYVRIVKNGAETTEYSKNMLSSFDSSSTKFEYFAYKPYTNTGSYATANLLSNPDFDTDATLWTGSALAGGVPNIIYNVTGSYSGGSATITPAGGAPSRLWITNNANLTIALGETYLVTGYTKSASGNINLRGFFHKAGDAATVYSDRIAETYASATGGTFSFYLTTNTGASDAQFSLETSNQGVNYEIDAISVRRMTGVTKNSSTIEVFAFSNTGSSAYDQACPGGAPCSAYVDSANARNGWPVNILGYETALRFWDNNGNPHTNILSVPTCSIMLSPGGSVPTGQPVTASWIATGSLSQTITYVPNTNTGGVTENAASSGSKIYIPEYDKSTNFTVNILNDIGTGSCYVAVTASNLPPDIYTIVYTGSEDDIQINTTLSGTDPNPGDSVFFEGVPGTTTQGFPVNVDLSGSVQYSPGTNFCGNDSFDFRVYDNWGHYSSWTTQTINVTCVNDAPVVVNDTGSAYAGTLYSFDPTSNDTDVDNPYVTQTLTITGYTFPANGTLSLLGNTFDYTANLGYSGSDSFQYSIVDQSGAISNTGTVNLSVTIFNNPPTVSDSGYTINEDAPLSGTLTGTDLDGDPLTFTGTSTSSGVLNLLSDGTFTYTPDANVFGTDSFTFMAYDGTNYSAPATVIITINPVPDAPIAVADSYTLNQDTPMTLFVMTNDSDVDSPVLTLTGYSTPLHGVLAVSGTGFLYTPTTSYVGTDSFTYQLIDETSLLSNIVTVSLNVSSTNSPPTATGASYTFNEDTVQTGVLIASDPESSPLTYTVDVDPLLGFLTVTSTGAFTYTPLLNYFGTESFTFHVSDGVFNSSGATVDLTLLPVNDPPIGTPDSFFASGNIVGNNGHTLTGSLSGTDIEGDILTFTGTQPVHGTFSMTSTGAFTYTPALGYSGSDSFTFVVNDGLIDSTGAATVNITVESVVSNIPIANAASFSLSGNIAGNSGHILTANLTAISPPGLPLTFSASILPSNGTLSLNSSGAFTYTPTFGYSGSDSFTFFVDNGMYQSSGAIVNIIIFPVVNNPPVATPASFSVIGNTLTNSGHFYAGNLAGIDAEGSPLTFSSATLPTHGNLSLTSTGAFTYTPVLGYSGSDSFTFFTNDGFLQSTNATVGITITDNTIVVLPPAPPTTGPGGGGGGSPSSAFQVNNEVGSSTNSNITNHFTMIDPTGLLGQLLLTNRILGATGSVVTNSGTTNPDTNSAASMIDSLIDTVLDELDGPIILRQIIRLFVVETDSSNDSVSAYSGALAKIRNISVESGSRMESTKKYAVRILKRNLKIYENIVYRNAVANSNNTSDSAGSGN